MECYCSLGCRGNMNTADCMTSPLCESSACDCGGRYDVRVNGRCGKYLPDHLCGGGEDGGGNKHMSDQGKKGKSSNRQPMIGDYGTGSKAQQTKDSPKEEKPGKLSSSKCDLASTTEQILTSLGHGNLILCLMDLPPMNITFSHRPI